MKIEIEQVSNGWVIRADRSKFQSEFDEMYGYGPIVVIARSVPDALAELSKIMERK